MRTGIEKNLISVRISSSGRIAANHKLATLPEVLVRRRMHAGQLTQKKAARTQEHRLAIYAAQLQLLGVLFTDTDLKRHLLLRSMRKRGFRPDLIYLEWAETWLLRLQAANHRAGCYPEPAFSQLLGRFWLKVCWYAVSDERWTVWWRFWRSALCKQTLKVAGNKERTANAGDVDTRNDDYIR